MPRKNLFDAIAPVYGLFFNYQAKSFATILDRAQQHVSIPKGARVLDIGCGTGALASCLANRGCRVTAVDASERMIEVSKKNNRQNNTEFLVADALKGLPYKDKSFDFVISSFVAHGLKPEPRKAFFAEAGRLAGKRLIIHDYNGRRKMLSDIVEWAERGDYFYFIRHAEEELKAMFPHVTVVTLAAQVAWYICTP